MQKLDEMIKQALEGEDQDIFEQTKEQGWFALGLGLFSGKLGWVNWIVMIVQTVMFLASVWCAIRFFGATEVLIALKYGISAAVLALGALAMKLSMMPQIQADRIIRELKRVELMLAVRNGSS